MTVYTLNARWHGSQIRIVAIRRNLRSALVDFDIRLIAQARGERCHYADLIIADFPRALGPEGLFAAVLNQISEKFCDGRVDENGLPVPMPVKTAEQWAAHGRELARQSVHCMNMAGKFGPEIVTPDEDGLFGPVRGQLSGGVR